MCLITFELEFIQFVDYKWQNDLSYNWISIEDKDAIDIVMDEIEAEDTATTSGGAVGGGVGGGDSIKREHYQ